CAVVSRYSKLVPVVSAACLIAPATCVGGIALTVATAMAPGLPALLGCPARAALGSIDSYGKRNLNRRRSRPLRGRDCNAGHRPAAQARRPLFRGFRGRQALRAPLHAHRHADGQHVVLQHDAQPAAAAHRPAFLRDRDRVGPAADELVVHAGADDRHSGVGHDRGYDHCQSRHDRCALPQSAVRGRHDSLPDHGGVEARIEVAAERGHRHLPSSGVQAGWKAGGGMPSQRVYHQAAGVMRSLLFVPANGGAKLDKAMASGADAVILDLEDSIAPESKQAAREACLEYLKAVVDRPNRPRLLVRINGLETGLTDADLAAIVPGKPDAILFPKAEGGTSVVHIDAKLAAQEALAGLPE